MSLRDIHPLRPLIPLSMLSVLSLKKSNRLLKRQQETSVVWVDIQLSVFPTVRHFVFFICNDVCNKLLLILIFLTTARGVDKHHTALTEPPVVVLLLRQRDRHHILHRIAAVPRSETAGCPPVRPLAPSPYSSTSSPTRHPLAASPIQKKPGSHAQCPPKKNTRHGSRAKKHTGGSPDNIKYKEFLVRHAVAANLQAIL